MSHAGSNIKIQENLTKENSIFVYDCFPFAKENVTETIFFYL